MARLSRMCVAGHLHLVLQRAPHGQTPLAAASDRESYLRCLREAAVAHRVAIHAYGLLPHEVRLLVTPEDAPALTRMIQAIGRRFVAGYNRRHRRSGALWEGRFRSTVVDPAEHFTACLRFVEGVPAALTAGRQGLEAGFSSSAGHHAGEHSDPLITEHASHWAIGNTPFDREAAHRRLQEHALTAEVVQRIENAALKGWALGSDRFVHSLGAQTSRRTRPLARGRPMRKT